VSLLFSQGREREREREERKKREREREKREKTLFNLAICRSLKINKNSRKNFIHLKNEYN